MFFNYPGWIVTINLIAFDHSSSYHIEINLSMFIVFLIFFFLGDNKQKNYLQLAGRCLLAFMFITLIRFEISFLQVIKLFQFIFFWIIEFFYIYISLWKTSSLLILYFTVKFLLFSVTYQLPPHFLSFYKYHMLLHPELHADCFY